MELKLAHLKMIQTIIDRMTTNSFLLKGWVVTLVSALFALAAKDANRSYFAIAFFPAIIFWILDGYFLSHERQYRALYDQVRSKAEHEIDFSMDTAQFRKGRNRWVNAFFSQTLMIFYGAILVIVAIVALL